MMRNFFKLIEFQVVTSCRKPSARLISAAHPIPAPGSRREGFGGEKAARKSASLPVPTNHQTSHRPIIAPQQILRSASGEVEQKREEIFPQKKREDCFVFFAALSPRAGRPQPSPTPIRTRHRHLAGRRGCGGRRTRPQPPTAKQRSPTRHLAGRRGCGGRRTRPQPPTAL